MKNDRPGKELWMAFLALNEEEEEAIAA